MVEVISQEFSECCLLVIDLSLIRNGHFIILAKSERLSIAHCLIHFAQGIESISRIVSVLRQEPGWLAKYLFDLSNLSLPGLPSRFWLSRHSLSLVHLHSLILFWGVSN